MSKDLDITGLIMVDYVNSLLYTKDMSPTISRTISNHGVIWSNRYTYTAVAAGVAFIAYILLFFVGFVPSEFRYDPADNLTNNQQDNTQASATVDDLSTAAPTGEQPQRITIDKIGVNSTIKNPVSTNPSTLNNYLAEGAVRWPTSGDPGYGNLFLFGHSTSHQTVFNQAYKTFNRLEELEEGDIISVETISGTYRYSVIDVEFRKDSSAYIPFDSGKNMLTLSTCNSFGAKEDRIIVRAEFEGYTPSL